MDYRNDGVYIFLTAILLRLFAIPLSVLRINPMAQNDVHDFEKAAELTASELLSLQIPSYPLTMTHDIWGTFLAPFWIIPGPSAVIARIFLAGLGALAIYHIYIVVSYYHSPTAGILATLPMVIYPTFVFSHATLLRESAILLGITSGLRYLIAPPPNLSRTSQYVIAGIGLTVAGMLRPDNIPIYLLTLGIGYALTHVSPRRLKYAVVSTSVTGILLTPIWFPTTQQLISRLSEIRDARAFGRAVYLPDVIPGSFVEVISFSWIGVLYFYFSPFPWMVGIIPDFVIFLESLGNIVFAIGAIVGVRIFIARHSAIAIALIIGFIVASVLYGIGTANFGTAMRHRQMFVWVLYAFGGMYFAEFDIRSGILTHSQVNAE